MPNAVASRRISSVTSFSIGTTGSGLHLCGVVVDTPVATSVITLKHKDTAGAVISVITVTADLKPFYLDFFGLHCPDGVFVDQTVAGSGAVILYGA